MSVLSKFKNGLKKGSDLLQGTLVRVSGNKPLDESELSELEEALYESDFGVESTEEIVEEIREVYRNEKAFKGTNTKEIAREVLRRVLDGSEARLDSVPKCRPEVICLVGVNGSGKTTTCAKLGHRFKENGTRPLLAANFLKINFCSNTLIL